MPPPYPKRIRITHISIGLYELEDEGLKQTTQAYEADVLAAVVVSLLASGACSVENSWTHDSPLSGVHIHHIVTDFLDDAREFMAHCNWVCRAGDVVWLLRDQYGATSILVQVFC